MMQNTGNLKISTPGDREITLTRVFDAPRRLVFAAMTRPEFLKQWLGVHNNWSLEVCEIDLRVGGKYRYVWRGPGRDEMAVSGVYLEVSPPERIVSTEKFDQSWYEGEAVGTLLLTEQGGRTTLNLTLRYESKQARDGVLKSPMEHGVAAGYDLLETLMASGRIHDAASR